MKQGLVQLLMATQLIDDNHLKEAAASAQQRFSNEPGYSDWFPKLAAHISRVQKADHAEFVSAAFQQLLWESEAVSATGMGTVDVSPLIESGPIAEMLWEFRGTPLPQEPAARAVELQRLWEKLNAAISPLVSRNPRLKMYRVFAALFPADFTTIAYGRNLRQLSKELGISRTAAKHPIQLHSEVLQRLAVVLGPVEPPPTSEGVARMALPWLLFAAHVQQPDDDTTTVDEGGAGPGPLKPLPAARRRKGLLAIAGYLPAIRSMIEFAREGCTRQDMLEHIRSVNPKLSERSVGTNLNALIAEWGVLKADGNALALTPRGESLLETGDASEVSDWLLTRILGFDNVLFRLRGGPARADELGAMLQKVNPGWTTRFGPDVLVKWVIRLGLADVDSAGRLGLTPEGHVWAKQIHWEPEDLPSSEAPLPAPVKPDAKETGLEKPSFERILAALPANAYLPKELVAKLDAGIWQNERRHFAVLTGLSGAGKTLLARCYALALWAGREKPQDGMFVLPVQPGWHDASALFGYVSPLLEDTYIRTGALDFLLRAAGDPRRPYTLILDEMNLSHPEQYLAPLLSAMETGDPIRFHTNEDEVSGVPPSVPYPSNLVVIGTVNMDETTHGLSDKVLDRAAVLDFWKVDVAVFPGWKTSGLGDSQTMVRDVLVKLCDCLQPVRLHFGWRTVGDVIGYMRAAAAGGAIDPLMALDNAVYGKILPKLRGEDTPRLRTALQTTAETLEQHGLRESAAKVAELLHDLKQTGSARFWR